jgi:PAS domain S-box-containing protein
MAIGSSTARIIDANPAFCDLLGRTREEVQGSPVIDMTHPDNRAALGSALLAALESGSPGFQLEELLIRSDGQAVPTFTSVACVRDSHGFLDYFIAHMVDLSELREAEDRFQHIVDSSPDVSIVVDRAGVVEMASRRLSEMFGYEPDDVIGQPVEILVPERLRAVHQLHRMSFTIDTVREMGSGLDLRGRRSDGSEFPVEVALGPIVVGGERKVLARVRDVTERRQGEAASKQLADMHAHQRQAIEINDNVMQGLTVARWSFDLGHVEAARDAVERTVETARLLVDRMLSSSGDIEPGTLRREQPTHSDS